MNTDLQVVPDTVEAKSSIAPTAFANEFDINSLLSTAGTLDVTTEQIEAIYEPIDPDVIEIRPDGIIYAPHPEFTRRLTKAFPLQWALIPQGLPTIVNDVKPSGKTKTTVTWGFWLIIKGKLASFAIGEMVYYPDNEKMSWTDAAEGAKSNALMRNCKGLGMFPEMWTPHFVKTWKKEYCMSAPDTKRPGKYLWWRKDRQAPRSAGLPDDPGKLKVSLKGAKARFEGSSPTVAQLYARDTDYCQWIADTITDKPVGNAMREYIKRQKNKTQKKTTKQKPTLLVAVQTAAKALADDKTKVGRTEFIKIIEDMQLTKIEVAEYVTDNTVADWKPYLRSVLKSGMVAYPTDEMIEGGNIAS